MARTSSRPTETLHPEGRLRDEILSRLDRIESGAWVDRLSPPADLGADDRRRVTEYLGGITRQRRWLDFVIDEFSSRRRPIDRRVRQVLRIGLYELIELRRAPHSSVYASVEQSKRLGSRGVERFVNGVLRSVARSLDTLPIPRTGDEVIDAAIRFSHPDWIVRRWVDQFGLAATEALMAYDNARPVHSIRVNTVKTSIDRFTELLDEMGLGWSRSRYLDEFVRPDGLQPLIDGGYLRSGIAAVQDESAGLVGRVLAPVPGEYVLDVCAAPGGKMIHAGIAMQNRGRLVGIDVNAKRLASADSAARAHGLTIVETIAGDFRTMTPGEQVPPADAVLLDAPCSGLGVLSRRPDLRWRRGEAAMDELVGLQDELLDTAARFVRPGGRLIYATCTITPEENEHRVANFLSRRRDFSLVSASGTIPESVCSDGFLVTLPHVHQIDGAFAALLVRR